METRDDRRPDRATPAAARATQPSGPAVRPPHGSAACARAIFGHALDQGIIYLKYFRFFKMAQKRTRCLTSRSPWIFT